MKEEKRWARFFLDWIDIHHRVSLQDAWADFECKEAELALLYE
jgi:hypothetical protein